MFHIIFVIPLFFSLGLCAVEQDLITNLPGANFEIKFAQYSGYLTPDASSFLHYWLVESQSDPKNDPLLLWLNGGPGCSSLEGLLTENGPFRVTDINMTIEENVYAWNKLANVLYLESPTKVGFSYTTANHTIYSDNETALLNYNALKDFFAKYPEYNDRDFFISGESYAGIYLPTLSMYLIQDPTIKSHFKGMAIGNGFISRGYLANALPPMLYDHSLVGEKDWNDITYNCCSGNAMKCNYSAILHDGKSECLKLVGIVSNIAHISGLDPYDLYNTCYVDAELPDRKRTVYYQTFLKQFGLTFAKLDKLVEEAGLIVKKPEIDSAPDCYYNGITLYLGRDDVREALHIPAEADRWKECDDRVSLPWERQYNDMAYQLQFAIDAGVRVLIYNGDVDTVCNAIGDKQFIDSLGRKQVNKTLPWFYDQDYKNRNAGWQTLYEGIHFLSVRGSGHFVPEDKPREALQMIANFVWDKDYSTPTGIDVTLQPLLATSTIPSTTPNGSQSLRSCLSVSILVCIIASILLYL